MKKCPYCGHENDDTAWKCSKCQAGFPNEKAKDNSDNTVKTTKTRRVNKNGT